MNDVQGNGINMPPNPDLTARKLDAGRTAAILILMAAAVAFSFNFMNLKKTALGYHTRDYAYYLEFSAKLLDSQLTKVYSINPIGINFFGVNDVEGKASFHQSIHFEPVKYAYALLYRLSGGVELVFILVSMMVYAPVAYLLMITTDKLAKKWNFIFYFSLVYILLPSSLLLPAYDLRPYIFLLPAFWFVFISLYYDRPLWEILIFYNFLFLVREESLIIGLLYIPFAAMAIRDGPKKRSALLSMGVSWLFWFAVMNIYYSWTGYVYSFSGYLSETVYSIVSNFSKNPISALGILVIAGLIVLFLVHSSRSMASAERRRFFGLIGSYGILPAVFLYQYTQYDRLNLQNLNAEWFQNLIFNPRFTVILLSFFGFIFILRDFYYLGLNLHHKAGRIILQGVIGLFVIANIIFSQSAPRMIFHYIQETERSAEIFDLRNQLNRHDDWILTDYALHQVFYDFEHVMAYNRLPWYLAAGDQRFYPENSEIIQKYVDEKIQFILVAPDSLDHLRPFLPGDHVKAQVLKQTDRMIAIRILR